MSNLWLQQTGQLFHDPSEFPCVFGCLEFGCTQRRCTVHAIFGIYGGLVPTTQKAPRPSVTIPGVHFCNQKCLDGINHSLKCHWNAELTLCVRDTFLCLNSRQKKTVWTTSALKKPKILFLIWVILKDRIKEIGKRLYINIHLASSQLSLSASGWNIPGLGWQLWFSFVVTDRWRKLNLQNFMWRFSKNPLSNAANDRPNCKI